jgi:hypothetical protein
MSASPPPDNWLQLLEWRPLRQNTLRGFAMVRLAPLGLIVHDVPVHGGGHTAYALMPGKPQIDQAGKVLTDDQRRYSPVIEIRDRAVRERISAAVVALVRQRDPEALS